MGKISPSDTRRKNKRLYLGHSNAEIDTILEQVCADTIIDGVFHTQQSTSNEILRDAKYVHFGSSYILYDHSKCGDMNCRCVGIRMPNVVHVSGVPKIKAISLAHMFRQSKLTNSPDLALWDVSGVQDFLGMFADATTFDTDIGGWDVSNAKNMCCMFLRAHKFGADLGRWNVSNLEYIVNMFYRAYSFHSDLSSWNLSNLIESDYAFYQSGAKNWLNQNNEQLQFL